jgi:hypothetical protein
MESYHWKASASHYTSSTRLKETGTKSMTTGSWKSHSSLRRTWVIQLQALRLLKQAVHLSRVFCREAQVHHTAVQDKGGCRHYGK